MMMVMMVVGDFLLCLINLAVLFGHHNVTMETALKLQWSSS